MMQWGGNAWKGRSHTSFFGTAPLHMTQPTKRSTTRSHCTKQTNQ